MNRRAAIKSAWSDYWSDQDDRPPINHYFECGFDAAWDALLMEIRPLLDAVLSAHPQGDAYYEASKRLRELVREAGE